MKYIHWLYPDHNICNHLLKTHQLASVRFRASILSELALKEYKKYSFSFGDTPPSKTDLLFISKFPNIANVNSNIELTNAWISYLKKAKEQKSKIILDYTDDHLFIQSPSALFYKKLIPLVDAITTPSMSLKEKLSQIFTGQILIIEDPLEISICQPVKKNNPSREILWFGHSSNIIYLINLIKNWPTLPFKSTINILTNDKGLKILSKYNNLSSKKLSITSDIWSIDKMIILSQICDLCIIPSDANDPKKSGASSNRLITSLSLGLPTAAERLNSYLEFSDYFVDIKSNEFVNILINPNDYINQTIQGQTQITKFKREEMYKKWASLINNQLISN